MTRAARGRRESEAARKPDDVCAANQKSPALKLSAAMRAGLEAVDRLEEREALQPPASLLENASPAAQRFAYQLAEEVERREQRIRKLFKLDGRK